MKDFKTIHESEPMIAYHDMNSYHDSSPEVLKRKALMPRRVQNLQAYRDKRPKIKEEIEFYKKLLETDLSDTEKQEAIIQLERWQRELQNNYQAIYRFEKLIADPNFKTPRRKKDSSVGKVKKNLVVKVIQLDEITDQICNKKGLFIMGHFSAGKHKWAERVEFRKGALHFFKGHEVGNFCDYITIAEKSIDY